MEEKDTDQHDYNLFLSWSGERSRMAAEAFKTWITHVQSIARPWISSKDAAAGRPWFEEVQARLKQAVGVVFITPENCDNPWLNFEAGAILGNIGQRGRMFIVLIHFPSGLPATHPLANIQYVHGDERGFERIFTGIAVALAKEKPDEKMLGSAFKGCWSDLQEGLALVPAEFDSDVQPDTTNHLAEIREALSVQSRALSQISEEVRKVSMGQSLMASSQVENANLLPSRQFGVGGHLTPRSSILDALSASNVVVSDLIRADVAKLDEARSAYELALINSAEPRLSPSKKLK